MSLTAALTFAAGFVAFPVLLVAWAVLWDLRPECWASRRVFRGLEGWSAGVTVPRRDPLRRAGRSWSVAFGRIRIVGEQDFRFRGDGAEELTAFCAAPGFGVRTWGGLRTYEKRMVSHIVAARAFGLHLRASYSHPNRDRDEIADYDAAQEVERAAMIERVMAPRP